MAQYFKDLGKNLRSGYHELRKNPALKGMDDYFDKINAGGGEGLADFAVDMSGIADMYQVGKQGAHIADDLFREGKAWDEVDQGRKDAFERGAYGTALTLAPLPGLKAIGAGGKYATKGMRTMGGAIPGKALAKGGKKAKTPAQMLSKLERAHVKAGTGMAGAAKLAGMSDKQIGKAYNKFRGVPGPGRAGYSGLGGNADILAPGIGKTRRALRALGGIPLTKGWRSKFPQRAAAVAMKDWDWGEHPSGMSNPFYRGEYAGQGANDTNVMDAVMGATFPGQQGGPGKEGQSGVDGLGLSMEDYVERGVDDPRLSEAMSGGSLQAAAAANALADIASPNPPYSPKSSDKKPVSLEEPSPDSTDPGAPVFDPRTNEFVRAESLTAEERKAFAGETAAAMKNLDPFNRTQTHDPKTGDLRGPGSNWRQQLQRQLDQEKSLKKVHEGYRSDRGREAARGSEIYNSSTDQEANNRPTQLSDMDIHKQVSAHKVAQDNRDRGHIPTAQDILTDPDNPFREFYSDDYRSQLEREARSDEDYREDAELENWRPGDMLAPGIHNYGDDIPRRDERLQDRQEDFNPEMPPLSEPRPIPELDFSSEDEDLAHLSQALPEAQGDEHAASMRQSLQNLDLSSELEAGKDLIPGLDKLLSDPPFSPVPSTNGTSTTIRDLNEPAPSSIENELMEGPGTPAPAQWEGDLMEGPGTPAPAQWEGDLMPSVGREIAQLEEALLEDPNNTELLLRLAELQAQL